ncbi:hypothetical protein KEM54_005865 [Ascosphaera aggregata]|nr:hypothetical protein KEM54_005865 [Ascosphaera aggregata]
MSTTSSALSTVTQTTTDAATTTTGMPNNCAANIYEMPVRDAACGMPNKGNNTDILKSCCGKAPVETYPNKCGLYCLAIGQELRELRECLIKLNMGVDTFCNNSAPSTAMATGTATQTSTSTEPSTKTKTSGTSTATSTSGSSSDSDANSAIVPHLSTAGIGMLAIMVCSAVFGAL